MLVLILSVFTNTDAFLWNGNYLANLMQSVTSLVQKQKQFIRLYHTNFVNDNIVFVVKINCAVVDCICYNSL